MKIVFLVILTFLLASCSGNIDASKFLAERGSGLHPWQCPLENETQPIDILHKSANFAS